jgi:phosphoserine phosphatase
LSTRGLVAFDLDGTLASIWSAWSWIHRLLGTVEDAKPFAEQYFAGEIDYTRWAELDVSLWKGVKLSRIKEAITKKIEFVQGASELIQTLHSWNVKSAIISSGLTVFTDYAKKVLNVDLSQANLLLTDNQGRIKGVQVKVAYDNKHQVLTDIARRLNIALQNCVAIGDSRNDIPMFQIAGLAIAFNADLEEVKQKATLSITSKNALELLPPLRQFFLE